MKYLFDYFVDSCSLFDNVIYDSLVMGCIGIISYHVAYSLVGRLYRSNSINTRGAGHILHWTIRSVVFVIIFLLMILFELFGGISSIFLILIGGIIGIMITALIKSKEI